MKKKKVSTFSPPQEKKWIMEVLLLWGKSTSNDTHDLNLKPRNPQTVILSFECPIQLNI